MEKLTGTQRKYLRGLAHSLRPSIQLGNSGLTPEWVTSFNEAISAHELIKIQFLAFKDEKREYGRQIEELTESEMVGLIGNMGIFYRQHPDQDKRQIRIPGANAD